MSKHCWPVIIGVVLALLKGSDASDAEQRLQSDLFGRYNKYIRPVLNTSEPVLLNIGLSITQLLDVDEKNQIITTGVWMNQWWVDYRFIWDPDDYDGLDSIIVPFEWVWYPDIVLDNSADGKYELPTWKYTSILSDGTVWVTPPGVLKSPCLIKVEFFPFDSQKCNLSFGPWEFTALTVRLTPIEDHVVRENYVENVEWELTDSSALEIYEANECCPDEAYSVVMYTIELRRRPLFYVLNILVPCLVMSLLTLVVFYLPSDSGEKMTLSISVLLAISVFNLLIFDIMPPTSDSVPLIGKYLLFNMALVMFSIILSVTVLNLHHRCMRTYRMPNWVRKLFLYNIPRFVCLAPYPFDASKLRNEYLMSCDQDEWSDLPPDMVNKFRSGSMVQSDNLAFTVDDKHLTGHSQKDLPLRTISKKMATKGRVKLNASPSRSSIVDLDRPLDSTCNGTAPQLFSLSDLANGGRSAPHTDKSVPSDNLERTLIEELEFITRRLKFDDWDYEVREEWKYVAMVVDRLCLIFFFTATVVGTCGILFSAPALSS
ncbi:neuronal acetylcholine receptor subunit beta-2-like [Ptychodera flava]|uniref:neuronal acetylcholine receptor subunit beta-2-like n=1 Tax=Ptychodera flava TaxID=63121 RepID=UPI00396AAC6B